MTNINRSFLSTALTLGLGLTLGLSAPSLTYAASLTRTSAFDYDATSGLLTKEIIEPDTSNLCLVTTYGYDGYGNKYAATTRNCNGSAGSVSGVNDEAASPTGDPVFSSRTNSSSYSSGSTSVSGTTYTWVAGQFATSSSNALIQSESREFDPRFGAPTKLTGPNSLATQWGYDAFGRKVAEKRADGTGTTWSYQYCSGVNGGSASCPTNIGGVAGAYVVTATPVAGPIDLTANPVTTGGANGAASKSYYDALNREIRSETQGYDGSGSSTPIYKDTQYDSLGRPYMTSRPYYAGQTPCTISGIAGPCWITLNYDSIGRVSSQVLPPDGTSTNFTTTTAYNGTVTTVTNVNSQTRVTTKNSQGQAVTVTDAAGKTLTYYYDQFGNLIETQDSANNLTYLTYDLRGRKTQMIDRDMGTWTYAYDALGQLIRQVDAKGQTSTLTYDLLGRMTNRSEADLVSNWYYDTYKGGGTCTKGIGKLCQNETSTGYGKTITYDILGRYSSASTTIDTTYTDIVSYDTNGRVATHTYPTGFVASYGYTSLGYLQQVSNGGSTVYWGGGTSATALDAEGHLLQQTYGNGVVTQQTYNAANGRITGLVAGAYHGVQNLSYTYDNLGNIWSRNDANQTLLESFTYDSLNRVQTATVNATAVSPPVTTTFNYDTAGIGNIASRSDLGTYTYNASGATSVRPHAVTRVDFTGGGYRTYVYDGNGNLSAQTEYDSGNNPIANKSRVEFYTSFNMPTSLGSPLVSEAFYYGPEHQRVRQISSNRGTTIYLNPGNNGDLSYEKDTHADSSTEERHFITAGGSVVAMVKKTVVGGTTTWTTLYLHRDNLGSTTAVTDASGSVIERLAYEPFGKRRFAAGPTDPNNTIVGVNTDRGFTNHEMLDELELVHMNGRIYDPSLGRFMSPDPNIQDPANLQSYNRYNYVLNNPLLYSDPSGYFSWSGFFDGWAHLAGFGNAQLGRIVIAIAAAATAQDWVTGMLNGATEAAGEVAGESTAFSEITYYTQISTPGIAVAVPTLTPLGSAIAVSAGGFAGGFVGSGGNFRDGMIGSLTALGFNEVGDLTNGHNPGRDYFGTGQFYENVAGHALVGCASGAASGSGCGRGALSAGTADFFTPLLAKGIYGLVETTVIGGTASVLGGGKFANGAETAAFGYLYNAWDDDSHTRGGCLFKGCESADTAFDHIAICGGAAADGGTAGGCVTGNGTYVPYGGGATGKVTAQLVVSLNGNILDYLSGWSFNGQATPLVGVGWSPSSNIWAWTMGTSRGVSATYGLVKQKQP